MTSGAVFQERPTEFVMSEALVLGAAPLALAGVFGALGVPVLGFACLGLTLFVGFFFRNPMRLLPGDERTVVAPADGRVLEAGEVELENGTKVKRVAISLSIFNVHVNRAPVAGRVVSVERSGSARCDMALETAESEPIVLSQVAGRIAPRVDCHPRVGEWLERGSRYGLVRLGSRTEVVLPDTAALRVARGEPVRGGKSVIAQLPRDET